MRKTALFTFARGMPYFLLFIMAHKHKSDSIDGSIVSIIKHTVKGRNTDENIGQLRLSFFSSSLFFCFFFAFMLSVLKLTVLSEQIVEDDKEFNSTLSVWTLFLFTVTNSMKKSIVSRPTR